MADIVFKAIMETSIQFSNLNYKEGVRYLALNWTAQECRLNPLRRVLPRRRCKNGTRPGMTGQGPMGPGEGKLEQWVFPRVTLTALEKKMIVAEVMRVAVRTMFRTHVYTFDNKYYLQKKGGPIGVRGTCAVARLTMIEWDRLWAKMMEGQGLDILELAR